MVCEVSSVAMGDIAFNLLIFFVILAKSQDDSHLKWQPAHTPKVESAGETKISIVVDIKNKLYLNSREIGEEQLANEVGKMLQNAPQGKRTVLLKIHRETQHLRFSKIIQAVSEAGGELVHVLEEKKT